MKKVLFSVTLFLLLCLAKQSTSLDYVYHNYEQLTTILKDYAAKYPSKTYLYSIGKSVQNRELWVLAISSTRPETHVLLRPEVKLVANMHGSTYPSGEVLLSFIDYLLVNPSADPSVDYILRNIRVHVLVSMNPDGVEVALTAPVSCINEAGRNNSNNFDLNRNFPDRVSCNREPMQPETKAIIDWMEANTFVLSIKLMTGFLVAIYPWENFRMPKKVARHSDSDVDLPTDFDDMFRYLASRYSLNNKYMMNVTCEKKIFPDGIANGAHGFHRIKGGMQDFNFYRYGCPELTIGVSCCKAPPVTELAALWQNNTKSLVELTKRGNTGIRGMIEFKNRGPASFIGVRFDTRDPIFKTNSLGEYYALLVPGVYTMSVVLSCDDVLFTSRVEVPMRSRLLVLNVTLSEKDYEKFHTVYVDKYPLFCNKSNAVAKCKPRHGNDTSSDDDEEDEEHGKDGHGKSNASCPLTNIELMFVTFIALIIYERIRN